MVSSADPFCAAPPRSSLLDHRIDGNYQQQHHRRHGRASVQFSSDNSSPRTASSSSSSSSPAPLPAGAPPRATLQQHGREVTSRYRSPTPDVVASRCRSHSFSAHLSSGVPRRVASSLSAERSCLDATPASKRAVSAERRHLSPTRQSKLSSVPNGHGSSQLPARRISSTIRAARSDAPWPTTSKNLYLSMQAESCSYSPKSPARTRHESTRQTSSSLLSDHTLRPSSNCGQRLPDQRRRTPERKGTPLRRLSSDQLENAKPAEGSHSHPEQVLKHRWPSSVTTLNFHGNALSKSVNLGKDRDKSAGRARSVNMLHTRPTSFSSQVITRVLPNSSGVFSHTINEEPASSVLRSAARKLSLENRSQITGRDSPVKIKRGVHESPDALNAASSWTADSLDFGRCSAGEAELASEVYMTDDMEGEAKIGCSVRSSFGMTRAAMASTRTLSDVSAGKIRGHSEAHRLQNSAADSEYYRVTAAGRQIASSRQGLTLRSEARAGYSANPPWPRSPNHSVPALKLAQDQSPYPLRISSVRSLPSPAGSRVSVSSSSSSSTGCSAALQFVADLRKSRKGPSQVEATYLHRILHSRLLQWRFANAWADFVNTSHRQAGEKLLFSVWAKTAEIRKSVTSKRIKLQQARQAHKINRILRLQRVRLEQWATVQQHHSLALSGVVEALEAAVLRIPVNEGIKADTQGVKEALTSAVDLVHAVETSVNRLLPKTEKTNALMSELAQAADQERTLLEECGDLLMVASSLEVEERSLRLQVLQIEQEKACLLGPLMANGD